MSSESRRLLVAFLPVVAYMALIYALSSMPGGPAWIPLFPFADKGAHFVEYGGLGFLTSRAAFLAFPTKSTIRLLAFAWLVAAAFGISDELHQAFVPGRHGGDVADLFADAVGAFAGAVAFAVVARVVRAR